VISPATHRLRSRVLAFGVVSGLGWLLDFGIFTALLRAGATPFLANAAGAACAVTWVYAASVRRIFRYHGRFLAAKFLLYAGWQVVGVSAASWGVDRLVHPGGLAPIWAKVAVTPLTFFANYLFMAWLTRPGAPAAHD
jgi:putative flippase GtrA